MYHLERFQYGDHAIMTVAVWDISTSFSEGSTANGVCVCVSGKRTEVI